MWAITVYPPKREKKVYLHENKHWNILGEVNGVWLVLCWHKRLMRCVFAQRRGDNDALYGRGSVACPRGHHNDTPQISLSGLLIGHGHLPLHPHTLPRHTHTHIHGCKTRKNTFFTCIEETNLYTYRFQVNKLGDSSQNARYCLSSSIHSLLHKHTDFIKHTWESDTLHIPNVLAYTHTATPLRMDTQTHTYTHFMDNFGP